MVLQAARGSLRSLWAEPRVSDPPALNRWDWALVAVLGTLALGETILRPHLELRPIAFLIGALPIATLLLRRSHPLVAVFVAFGIHGLSYLVPTSAHNHEDLTLYATAFILLLPYSLLRWASGREAVVGLVFTFITHVGVFFEEPAALGETLAGFAVLALPAALGATMRYRAVSRLRTIDQVKSQEREQLARELHDIVAHHVSAIAIQAQAGRAVADSDPDAALKVLHVIEAEASRTLTEMRTMVSALRGSTDARAGLAPQRGVEDIALLADQTPGGPVIEVVPAGDLRDLPPAVDAAVYRLAQESITNAIKHARRVTRINVAVEGEPAAVRLTVSDDGEAAVITGSSEGYGIIGMRERVSLLGGTFEAGPDRHSGWTVTAVLPRNGRAS